MTVTGTAQASENAQSGRMLKLWLWSARHPAIFPAAMIVLTCVVIGVLNPDFLHIANLFDILRASAIRGLFALGVFVVLAAGGLDVSFTAIAAFVMYALTLIVVNFLPGTGIVPIIACA